MQSTPAAAALPAFDRGHSLQGSSGPDVSIRGQPPFVQVEKSSGADVNMGAS